LKEHSEFCKDIEGASAALKANLQEIFSLISYFFMKHRELTVKYALLQKDIDRLSRQKGKEL